jgi:hypothetical protein
VRPVTISRDGVSFPPLARSAEAELGIAPAPPPFIFQSTRIFPMNETERWDRIRLKLIHDQAMTTDQIVEWFRSKFQQNVSVFAAENVRQQCLATIRVIKSHIAEGL